MLGVFLSACTPAPPKVLAGYEAPVKLGTRIQDAVDGAHCVRKTDTEVAVFKERNFYFCVVDNREVFNQQPEKYGYR